MSVVASVAWAQGAGGGGGTSSALVSLAITPGDVAELGFQLSYLAVLGILVLAPCLRVRRPLTDSQRLTAAPWATARAWIGAINEVVVRWLYADPPERLEDSLPALTSLLLLSVGYEKPQADG